MPDMKEMSSTDALKRSGDVVELKVDGSRHSWDGSNLTSDRGIIRNDRFPHIIQELQSIDAEVRGEVAIPGGNVLQLNKKGNWGNSRFYIFDVHELKGQDVRGSTPFDNRKMVDEILRPRWVNLRSPRRFRNVKEGWDFVNKQLDKGRYAEGIVLKPLSGKVLKIKKLQEAKVQIVGHIPGALKGAFQIELNGASSKVSASSIAYVNEYNRRSAVGECIYAEIEYQFLTDNGIPFQPRLRRIGTLNDLKTDF